MTYTRPSTYVRHSPWAHALGIASHVESLLRRLSTTALDRSFEAHGDFIVHLAPDLPRGYVRFVGAFLGAHEPWFHIETRDPADIEALTKAIEQNQLRADYLRQPPPYRRERLLILRDQHSTTQGTVRLIYAGAELGVFGATIAISAGGEWEGHIDELWHYAAARLLAERHAQAIARILEEPAP